MRSNIETLTGITFKKSNNLFKLKKGSFNQADSIDLEVNKAKQIIAAYFYYDSIFVYGYDNRVEAFTKHFNFDGKEFQFTSKDRVIKVTKWEDPITIFELVEITKNKIPFFYGVIFDKDLYLKEKNLKINLKRNDNSLELLKVLGLI